MLLTNHTLTGVFLGLTIDNEALLAPTAVASHLALDMVPHFGYITMVGNLRAPLFFVIGAIDFAGSALVLTAACVAWPHRIGHIVIGTIGADLPDLTYLPIVVFGYRITRLVPGYTALIRFLERIQWYEKPLGLVTETLWAGLMLFLLGLPLAR